MRRIIELFSSAKSEIIGGLTVAAVLGLLSFLGSRLGSGNPWVVAGLLLAMLWVLCVYVAFKRRPAKSKSKIHAWQFPRWRRQALILVIAIPVLLAGLGSYHMIQSAEDSKRIKIIVANFDGPEPERYRVTDTILSQLQNELEPYKADVRLEILGRAIKENETDIETGKTGSDAARAIAKKHKADIIMWGWYGVTTEAVALSVNFDVPGLSASLPELCPAAKGEVRTIDVRRLESFQLQTGLSDELTYLSLVTLGIIDLASGDLTGAVSSFSDALEQTQEPVATLDQSVVYLYRGNTYLKGGNLIKALGDHNKAIALRPNFELAHYSQGFINRALGDFKAAVVDFDNAIRLDAANACAQYYRAVSLEAIGEFEAAIKGYDQAIPLFVDASSKAALYLAKGNAIASHGQIDSAMAEFQRSLDLYGDGWERANVFLAIGQAHLRNADLETATTYFDQAIDVCSDKTCEVNTSIARIYLESGYYKEANKYFSQAAKLSSDQTTKVNLYINLGISQYYQGNIREAIQSLNNAIRVSGNDVVTTAAAYMVRGAAYMADGKPELAIADLDRAVSLSPDSPLKAFAFANRASFHQSQDHLDEAIADYTAAVRLLSDGPKKAELYYSLGSIYGSKTDIEKAIANYSVAIDLFGASPLETLSGKPAIDMDLGGMQLAFQAPLQDHIAEFADACYQRGLAYDSLGESDKAIADFNKALDLNPKSAGTWYSRGNAYYHKGDLEKAIADLNKASELDPSHAPTYFTRGVAHHDSGHLKEAIADLLHYLSLSKDAEWRSKAQGILCDLSGELATDVQLTFQTPFQDYATELADVCFQRGLNYYSQSDLNKAIADFNRALDLNPKSAGTWYSRGNAYYHKGDLEQAIADLNKASELDPNYDLTYFTRGVAHRDSGHLKEAVADLQRYLDLSKDAEWRAEAERILRELETNN